MGTAIKPRRAHGETLVAALPWILERVRSGIAINHACEAAGFSRQAIYKAASQDPGLKEALEQAKAEGELMLVDTIQEEARINPRFGLLVLERRRPDEWAPPKASEVNVAVQTNTTVINGKPLEEMSDAELEAYVAGSLDEGEG